MRLLICAVVCLSLGASALARNVSDDISDPNLLAASEREIAAMGSDELRMFADTLIECSTLFVEGKYKVDQCQKMNERYLLEFSDGRSLDVVWLAFSMTLSLIGNQTVSNVQKNVLITKVHEMRGRLEKSINSAFILRRKLLQK
jgi:heme exporter protein D